MLGGQPGTFSLWASSRASTQIVIRSPPRDWISYQLEVNRPVTDTLALARPNTEAW